MKLTYFWSFSTTFSHFWPLLATLASFGCLMLLLVALAALPACDCFWLLWVLLATFGPLFGAFMPLFATFGHFWLLLTVLCHFLTHILPILAVSSRFSPFKLFFWLLLAAFGCLWLPASFSVGDVIDIFGQSFCSHQLQPFLDRYSQSAQAFLQIRITTDNCG